MPSREDYECVVVGGGPAGATTATLLADHGHRVLLLERERFPRHHIGESLMPQTYTTLQRLGMLDQLRASRFPRKQSVQFVSATGQDSQPYYFTDRDPHESSITWQVPRDRFDHMMLANARAHGVDVHEGVGVRQVLFKGGRTVGVQAQANGRPREIGADVVVDATGMSALLARQLDVRVPDAKLRNAAVYAYYAGAQRDEGRNAGATIVIHTADRQGWFWFIPLDNDVTSVGVVAPPTYLFSGRGDDPAATLDEEIEACPGARRRLAAASRVSKAYVTSDFSYRSTRLAGDGWVLVGDAFGFLDPVYSSGVMLALKSGEFAADAIHDALGAGDPSAARLGRFGPQLLAGMELIRRLVYVFYDRGFSFSKFNRAHPECTDHLIRMLIGDVFNDEVGAIFDVLGEWVTLPRPMRLDGLETA